MATSTVMDSVSASSRSPKYRPSRKATSRMAKMKSLEEWESSMPAGVRASMVSMFGSTQRAYAAFLEEAQKAAQSRQPTTIHAKRGPAA